MGLKGELDTFTTPDGLLYPYFTSGDLSSRRALVFIGGLTNGLGGVPYLPKLSAALGNAGWKLVQLHWTSAYNGFGTSSLDTDVKELSYLIQHLTRDTSPAGADKVVVMGHSTGSQDVIHYLLTSPQSTKADGGIMQAPASDREHFVQDPESKSWVDMLPTAEKMVKEGRGQELLPDQFCKDNGFPINAYRLYALMSPGGDDDYFSSDLPDKADGVHCHPLDDTFGKLDRPALVLYSEKDEYGHVKDLPAHLHRWEVAAKGHLSTRIIEGANHAVEDAQHQDVLAEAVVFWLASTFP